MSQSRKSLIQSSALMIFTILGIGVSISTPKPFRILPLTITLGLASSVVYCAQKGIQPATIEAMDRAAELACLEAERENALEEIQESDDIERELMAYERRCNIEAEALRRTLPAQIELQKMRQVLYPVPVPVSAASSPETIANSPDPTGLNPTAETALFDWNSLKDADRHPILGLIAKMGGGKSLLAKYLGKHILGGSVTVFDIYGSQQDWSGCEVLFDFGEMVLRMEQDNKGIEQDIAAYRNGKRDFRSQLFVLEEGKATIGRLQKLKIPGKKPGQIVQDWKLNYESVTRKIRRRLCLVSTNMNSSVLGLNAETRDEITLIFPGAQGIAKAMKDTQMLKLGARSNQHIRDRLISQLKGIKYPALVYHDGDWFAASIPELDNNGNPIGAANPPSEQIPSIEDLNRLLDLDVGDDS
ncbi:hypothetical protein NIES2135_53790 [Leptolyngbya boryana NIES-2135]|uniref:Uncharacterized protein n=1 Tax=Leptolyngbya boryana NIES-2135 TaxID=1973484 RepID=A0A1Z4JP62_LEPBY|nr:MULTISPECIES: hypothetical protein [Leptolyngbya]BAY58506.1 hypothetical protein NIES2135_53790 [Leptolyngbya boryana NIES-2135]MBD2370980.1 hypothetical protein [Leptolyngbya sp. FACHB-161]MBD2377494.1 hypothetical protein [Leptolyngbya sp. FACHB-238]MBD2401903.1 hypothetical protein [Leptolyngbya sp. FACHB-239]MBD2408420.1 hypothetical protein [Leptolyngbya sp. FACHB-402]